MGPQSGRLSMGGCSSSVGPHVRPLSLDRAQYSPMLSAPSQYLGAGVACKQANYTHLSHEPAGVFGVSMKKHFALPVRHTQMKLIRAERAQKTST